MDGHDARHEALLERITCGDLPCDSREAHELANCPQCDQRMAEFGRIGEWLDERGRGERREVLEAAGALDGAPGADATADVLARAFARERGSARWRAWGVAAVAAALLLAISLRAFLPEGGDEAPRVLGSSELVLTHPVGPSRAAGYSPFEWAFDLPSAGFYELRIWDASAPHAARPSLEILELTEPVWRPTETERASLPRAIRWEVRAYGASLELVAVKEALASSP